MLKWAVFILMFFVTTFKSSADTVFIDGIEINNDNKEVYCLAQNIYFESRNQPLVSKIGVGLVILNRVKSFSFPNTICKVVKQGKKWKQKIIRNQCQFSWYCDGKTDIPKDMVAWNQAWLLAVGMYGLKNHSLFDITNNATYYHADYVKPKWATKFKQTIKLGSHLFYRMEKK